MILVTGGAGFIGSALIKTLNDKGQNDIIVVDRMGSGEKWKNLRGLRFDSFIHADELFEEENAEWVDEVDCIFHIGACSSTTQMDMDYLMKNNVEYSKTLFDLATELHIPFIYASSAATYGSGEKGYSDKHEKVEGLLPLNPYGYSKQLFDEWVLAQKKRPPLWAGLKFFNVFGPNEYHKGDMRSMVHKAFGQIVESGKVKLFKSHKEGYEDGMQLRDFVYVKDVCRAILALRKSKKSGIYNLGTGTARSFKELIQATFKAMGKPEDIEYIPMPESIRDQYQYYTQAEMDKFHKVVRDFSFGPLEESVADYVKNHLQKDNPHL